MCKVTVNAEEWDKGLKLNLRSNNKEIVDIKDIKLFLNNGKCDKYNTSFIKIVVDRNKIICLKYNQKNITHSTEDISSNYRTVTFIITNHERQEQYAVSIPLDGGETSYTKMTYENFNKENKQ